MWKLGTWLAGLLILMAGAATGDFPDWDYGVSIWMALWTLLTAEWVVSVLMELDYRWWPIAVFWTWWAVDGSYWAYWSLVNPGVMIREGQWPTSLCLFLLCGFLCERGREFFERSLAPSRLWLDGAGRVAWWGSGFAAHHHPLKKHF